MSADRALAILAALVLEDGRRWGDVATPWQWDDASAVLDLGGPAPLHYLTRPRGASKTVDLAGVALAALLDQLPPGAQAYAVASDRDQARLLLDEVGAFAFRTPALAGQIDVGTWSATTKAGARIVALAADDSGAYGLRPHFVVADELAQWGTTTKPRRFWEAVVSAVPKVRGCRLAVLTTAGSPEHWSYRVLTHAKTEPRWRVHELPGPTPWIDPGALEEQRGLLTASQFARLHLNRWTEAEDRLVTHDDLAACVTLEGPLDPKAGRSYVVGVDLGLKSDRTVVSVVHGEARVDAGTNSRSTRVVLDRQAVWSGSRERPVDLDTVEAYTLEVHRQFGHPQFVVDPWQAAQLVQRMRRRGLRIIEYAFTAQSVGRLAQRLYTLLRDRALALPDDAELIEELANVRLRETSPGVFRLDHDADQHDDRAVSLALAALHVPDVHGGRLRVEVASGRIPSSSPSRPAQPRPRVTEFDPFVSAHLRRIRGRR